MEFIKRILRKLYTKLTGFGSSCGSCGFNDGGKCTRSRAEFMDCFHSITRPGWRGPVHEMTTEEEFRLMEKIVAALQEAEATARDGGLLGSDFDDKPASGLIEED